MSIEREKFLTILAESYSAYYDIDKQPPETALPLVFKADYYSRAERYWLSKNIPMWGNETNEFAYVFSAPSFDEALAAECIDFALAEGLPRVKPHKEHQYTNIKVLLVADSFDEAVIKYIRKRKFQKNYKLSLHGFTMLKTAAVDLSRSRAFPNRDGYELEKYFKKLFTSAEKNQRVNG